MTHPFILHILNDPDKASFTWCPRREEHAMAMKNHGQTLHRLEERGGLGWIELYCVLAGKELFSVAHNKENKERAKAWVKTRDFGKVAYRL